MFKYLDLDGLIKMSDTLTIFDSSIDWSARIGNYIKKHKEIEVIRKNNAYYGSYEVFCYYLQSAKSEVLDKSLCEVEVISWVLVKADFKEAKKEKNETLERVLFSGVAKKRDDNNISYKIPIIELDVKEVEFYSKVLKELIPDSIKKLIKEGRELRDISNRFQTYIKRNWSKYSDYNIDDMRDCRGAYALYCLLNDNKNATTEAYIKSILLHDTKESAGNYWTKFKMVK